MRKLIQKHGVKKLEEANITIDTGLPDWNEDKNLMAMLTSLCGKG